MSRSCEEAKGGAWYEAKRQEFIFIIVIIIFFPFMIISSTFDNTICVKNFTSHFMAKGSFWRQEEQRTKANKPLLRCPANNMVWKLPARIKLFMMIIQEFSTYLSVTSQNVELICATAKFISINFLIFIFWKYYSLSPLKSSVELVECPVYAV